MRKKKEQFLAINKKNGAQGEKMHYNKIIRCQKWGLESVKYSTKLTVLPPPL